MSKEKTPIRLFVAALVFISGWANILSIARPAVALRIEEIIELVPVQFIEATHIITLIIGLALVITSVNIYRGKRNAYLFALILALCSAVLHLTKTVDYEEAVTSVVLAIVLFLTRKSFTVSSEQPSLKSDLPKIILTISVILVYGILGFWFLDKREFRINFTIGESIYQTFHQMFFIDTGITPHTHHARLFLKSFHYLTVTAALYALSLLFRPVILRFRSSHKSEREVAKQIIQKDGHDIVDFFKYWPDKSFFFSNSGKSVISYGVKNGVAIALGDPVGPKDDLNSTIISFKQYCHDNGWSMAFYQTKKELLSKYEKNSLKYIKIGDDALVDLVSFSPEKLKQKDLRSVISRFEEKGFSYTYFNTPVPEDVIRQLETISNDWLENSKRKERTFTLGQFSREYVKNTPVFAVSNSEGKIVAFANLIYTTNQKEITVDLMRYSKNAPNGTMDYLFTKLLVHLKKENYLTFSMGMAPMSGFQTGEVSTKSEKVLHAFFQKLNFVFSFKGLKAYKAKFATHWEPRYLIYESISNLPAITIALGRISAYKK